MGKYRLPPPTSGPDKGSTMMFSDAKPVVIAGYNRHGYMVYANNEYTYMEPGAITPFKGTEEEKQELRNAKETHDKLPTHYRPKTQEEINAEKYAEAAKGGSRKGKGRSRKARKNKKRSTRRR